MTAVAGLLIILGLAGVVVPVIPGLLLVWAGVLVWFLDDRDAARMSVLIAVTLVLALGTVVKYLVPGKRLREAGVPWGTIALGGLLGIVGFFVVPVIGLVLGFVLGVWLGEMMRLGDSGPAWRSTRHAVVAVGLSILIELAAGLVATAIWAGAVVWLE
jgi:uncharacterized protein YqgC (DUF456 family)